VDDCSLEEAAGVVCGNINDTYFLQTTAQNKTLVNYAGSRSRN
jgi:hypothetical protein